MLVRVDGDTEPFLFKLLTYSLTLDGAIGLLLTIGGEAVVVVAEHDEDETDADLLNLYLMVL